jgi:hypothetical protein
MLSDKRLQEIFALNIGIIKGKTQFEQFISEQEFVDDIEEV